MRIPFILFALCSCMLVAGARAAAPIDPSLQQGLDTCMSNGLESGIHAWYPNRPELATEMTEKVVAATRRLGSIIDTEVVQIQPISKRVTRYYVAIYFTHSPLWIRIERYQSEDKAFFLPLKCSTNPDEILPAYVTEFLR